MHLRPQCYLCWGYKVGSGLGTWAVVLLARMTCSLRCYGPLGSFKENRKGATVSHSRPCGMRSKTPCQSKNSISPDSWRRPRTSLSRFVAVIWPRSSKKGLQLGSFGTGTIRNATLFFCPVVQALLLNTRKTSGPRANKLHGGPRVNPWIYNKLASACSRPQSIPY